MKIQTPINKLSLELGSELTAEQFVFEELWIRTKDKKVLKFKKYEESKKKARNK